MATFVINQSVFAADDISAAVSKLRTKVLKLAYNLALQQHGISEEEVALRFYVHIDRQIVVLKTDAESDCLDQFIKNKPSYREIRTRT